MRSLIFACFATCLFSCNSSSKKEDPNKAMDDTTRMDNPPEITYVTITVDKVMATDIPAGIKMKGTLVEGWKWKDKLGENLFLTSRIAPHDHKDQYGDEVQSAEVFAYHYVKKEGREYSSHWEMSDGGLNCSFDITCDFIGPVVFTDLDKNGVHEATFRIAIACRSDVSPAYMKQYTVEDVDAYVLQGNMWLAYSPDMKYEVTAENVNLEKLPKSKDETEQLEKSFGRYENEKDFLHAPTSFLDFARKEWLKYSKEKMGE